ncbi:MAG: hypothetical protein ABSA59_14260, partial [Terriglobia bacterium]
MRVRQHAGTHNGRVARPSPNRLSREIQWEERLATLAVLGTLLGGLALAVPAKAQNTDSPGPREIGLQLVQPIEPGQTSPHLTITLQDALDRAEKNDAQYSAALTDAKIAKEDHVQMRAAGLPSLGLQTSALLTQGNGAISSGRYVTNDGVHVYRQWGVVHQDFSLSTLTMLGDRRGAALEALARAKAQIARRGLKVTVTKDYYALVVSERKYATAQ